MIYNFVRFLYDLAHCVNIRVLNVISSRIDGRLENEDDDKRNPRSESLRLALQPIGVFFGSSSNSTHLAESLTVNGVAIRQ